MYLTRYSEPTKLDAAPYMSICKVGHRGKTVDIYVQRNTNEDDPRWEYLGAFDNDIEEEEIRVKVEEWK